MDMQRPISILLALLLLAGADAVLAHGGGHSSGRSFGGGVMATPSSGGARPTSHFAPGYQGVRPAGQPGWQGVRPAGHPGWQGVRPIADGRSPFRPGRPYHRRAFIGGTVIVGAPLVYPAPVYVSPAPVYVEPPVYIEQSAQIYYYCPDYQQYYPDVSSCPSPWLRVLPDGTPDPD
jgi:hypothetical protein